MFQGLAGSALDPLIQVSTGATRKKITLMCFWMPETPSISLIEIFLEKIRITESRLDAVTRRETVAESCNHGPGVERASGNLRRRFRRLGGSLFRLFRLSAAYQNQESKK